MNLEKYKTLVFDCDGVILNSNKVKTNAFYQAALPYGDKAAQQLVEYHIARGGISRFKKFEWFLENVVAGENGPNFDELLNNYAAEVSNGLLTCEVTKGLIELRNKTAHANWLIVSGGAQQELREVFSSRALDTLFDGGIFGSPDSKDLILTREIANKNIKQPALFLGDSLYDHSAASAANLDFIFLSDWSEFTSWPEYCDSNQIQTFKAISYLI